ncbi:MAG TPA: gamma-glutamyltransferase [Acidimicrobiales bacterium]|nr:gamma-glutamyltransferase [Acidimicrobiales bacterium]
MLEPAATYYAPGGMVCTVDHLASAAGVAVLRAGGNAVDAAIATGAVLTVTFQHRNGLGGDLLAVVVPPGEAPVAINSSGFAGSGANAAAARAEGLTRIPARNDIRAVTVPGCVDGWLALHERFGRLPLAEVLAAARDYAAEGFPVGPELAGEIHLIAERPGAADFIAGGPAHAGSRVRRPGVARLFEAIISDGREGFYGGEFGRELLEVGNGEFTPEDLTRPIAKWAPALGVEAFGHRLWTVPPASCGYLTLASAWIASQLDLPEDPEDPRWAHLLVEASRQASFDRLDVLHEEADGEALLSPERLAPRAAAIDPERASELPGSYLKGGTIALTAVDSDRMAVSMLQSNAWGFGSYLALPRLGVFLHNRGIGFSLDEGHPNEYRPGRRPVHTLCPTAVTGLDGSLTGVVASMGGDSQPQIVLQLLARWLHCGQEPGDALAAGRFILADPVAGAPFDTWQERGRVEVALEGQAAEGWDEGLAGRGHDVARRTPFNASFGHAHLIALEEGMLAGGTDPRPRSGGALGY